MSSKGAFMEGNVITIMKKLNSLTTATKCAVDLICLIGAQESSVNSIIQKDVVKTKSRRFKES
jgi:hypothetical protein